MASFRHFAWRFFFVISSFCVASFRYFVFSRGVFCYFVISRCVISLFRLFAWRYFVISLFCVALFRGKKTKWHKSATIANTVQFKFPFLFFKIGGNILRNQKLKRFDAFSNIF